VVYCPSTQYLCIDPTTYRFRTRLLPLSHLIPTQSWKYIGSSSLGAMRPIDVSHRCWPICAFVNDWASLIAKTVTSHTMNCTHNCCEKKAIMTCEMTHKNRWDGMNKFFTNWLKRTMVCWGICLKSDLWEQIRERIYAFHCSFVGLNPGTKIYFYVLNNNIRYD
jgi:hypothetical protein